MITKALTSAIFAALLLLVPEPTSACSLAGCLGRGVELRRDFAVLVKHEGKPLQGVTIRATDNSATVRFSGVTTSDGIVRAASLPPGDYWLSADLLGVNAAYHCFHVAERPSRRAKQRMIYDWGDLAPSTSRIQGALIDSQPGTGDTPLWNLVHRVNVPVREARLKLQNPITVLSSARSPTRTVLSRLTALRRGPMYSTSREVKVAGIMTRPIR